MTTSQKLSLPLLTQLRQLHAAERAQMSELRVLRDKCGVPAITRCLDEHLEQTREHGDLLEARLDELGSGPSVWNLVETFGSVMAKGVVERLRPLTTGDILREALTAEAAESADYLVLELDALRRGDTSTAVLAQEIRSDEEATIEQLRSHWHQAAKRDHDGAASAQLVHQLQMAHRVEQVAAGSLLMARSVVTDDVARARIDDHHAQTVRQAQDIANRVRELDAALPLLPVVGNVAASLVAAPMHAFKTPRPEQMLRNAFVIEYLEIATYEQLIATAELLGDERTVELAQRHLPEELAMVDWVERHAHLFVER